MPPKPAAPKGKSPGKPGKPGKPGAASKPGFAKPTITSDVKKTEKGALGGKIAGAGAPTTSGKKADGKSEADPLKDAKAVPPKTAAAAAAKPPKKKERVIKKKYLTGEEAKRYFCYKLARALCPIRTLATIFGQWPMSVRKETNGTYTFKYKPLHPTTIYFILMMALSFYCLFFGGWSMYVTVVNFYERPKPPFEEREERWYEKSLLHRHIMWVGSFMAAVIQSCASYFYLYRNRHYFPSILTFYFKVAYQLHMDISKGIFKPTMTLILIYFSSTIGIVLLGATHLAPVAIGAPTLFGIYISRLININAEHIWILDNDNLRLSIQLIGAVILCLMFTLSKIQMLFYIFHWKILRNSFACWNGRAYISLMKGGKYFLTQEGRVTFQLLYKDHCVMLDMLEAVNRLSAGPMEIYFGVQTATIFFEFYFLIRSGRYGDVKEFAYTGVDDGGSYFLRPLDWIPGCLLAFQSLIFAMYTSKIAAEVGTEAMAGLEILRRKTMLNRKTDDELVFQISMQASFNSYNLLDLSGGGYGYMNKDWILSYMNNIAGYFIILYQFQPAMDRDTKDEPERRKNLGEFLAKLEGLPSDHYVELTSPPAPVYQAG